MVKQIIIEQFKSIESAGLDLGRINVLVGANNSGKSSFLQALQFATSVAQTEKCIHKLQSSTGVVCGHHLSIPTTKSAYTTYSVIKIAVWPRRESSI